jgi:protein-disulfide isomerase
MTRHLLQVPVGLADHTLGPESARVTVVEYGDFECPYCAQAAPGIQLMLVRYAGNVRFAFRHFTQDVHPHAIAAAEATECAAAQQKFWPMHNLLYRRQSRLARPDLNRYAREVGLDIARFKVEMDEHAHLDRIQADLASGRRSGVRSTPGIFVDGRMLDVAFDLQTLYDVIDSSLA